jgi:hypothetical protein
MGDKQLTIPAMLSKFQTLADRSLKFAVVTQELDAATKAKLFEYEGLVGWFVFFQTQPREIEVPMDKPEFVGAKTPSERLYNKLYRLYKTMLDRKMIKETVKFEDFRRHEMEKLVDIYDRKIKEL